MRTVILSLSIFFSVFSFAQTSPAPKFAGKAMKAIVSLNTYDEKGDLLHSGVAFYVGANGEAMAEYSLFKDAYKATVIDASGKQADVDCILGADYTYRVVRFKVNTKKNAVLNMAAAPGSKATKVFALPYSQNKLTECGSATIEATSPIEGKYSYYTLSPVLDSTYMGAPLFNEKGELIAIVQAPIKEKSYALDIRYKDTLKIQAFMSKSLTQSLADIHISKGIPETVEEALVYSYFKSRTADNDEYLDIMNRFVTAFPRNAEGYQRRSVVLADLKRFEEADADLQKYLQFSADKATARYNAAQSILRKNQYQKDVPFEKWSLNYALALINDNQTLDAKILRGQIYTADKNYDKAIEVYKDLLSVDSLRHPSIYYTLSLVLEAHGDSLADVIVPLDSAISMFGTPLPAEAADYMLRRGQLLNKLGKYRRAVQDYNQYCFLVNNKVNAVFYYDRSQMEIKGRMYQQAYDDINKAVDMAPQVISYHVEHAGICLRVGQVDECITACQAALVLDAANQDALRMMGYAYVHKGDREQGRKYLQQAVDLGDETAKNIIDTYLK